MDSGKAFALFLLIMSATALYLHSQGKLYPILSAIVSPSNTSITIGAYAIAVIAFIILSSFIGTEYSMWLAGLIALDMLYTNDGKGVTVIEKVLNPGTL